MTDIAGARSTPWFREIDRSQCSSSEGSWVHRNRIGVIMKAMAKLTSVIGLRPNPSHE